MENDHRRPDGAGDGAVAAAGKLSEALERVERARGAAGPSLHQLMGGAECDARRRRRRSSAAEGPYGDLADRDPASGWWAATWHVGRWTFQLVEEFDDGYYALFRELERAVRDTTMDGRRHVFEAEMKARRRTHGHPAHEAEP